MSEKPILVAAAVIRREGRYLLAQRLATSRLEANKWEFPGGKVEFGESPEAGLVREIREELGLQIRVGRILAVASHVYVSDEGSTHIVLLAYLCDWVSGEAQRLEVQDAVWVAPAELRARPLAAADLPVIEALEKALERELAQGRNG